MPLIPTPLPPEDYKDEETKPLWEFKSLLLLSSEWRCDSVFGFLSFIYVFYWQVCEIHSYRILFSTVDAISLGHLPLWHKRGTTLYLYMKSTQLEHSHYDLNQ